MSTTAVKNSEIAGAEPFALASLVDYHDGAIVSRVILKRETGNITVFAFDAGQGLSEHTAPFDALVQAIDGTADVTIDGKPIVVCGGEVILFPAGKPHALLAQTRFKMMLSMIRA